MLTIWHVGGSASPTHAHTVPGDHVITLTVRHDDRGTSSQTAVVSVLAVPVEKPAIVATAALEDRESARCGLKSPCDDDADIILGRRLRPTPAVLMSRRGASVDPRLVIPEALPSSAAALGHGAASTPANEPRPIEMVEAGLAVDQGELVWAAVMRNPNARWWVARSVPISIDFLAGDGTLVGTDNAWVWVLPGQTCAIVGGKYAPEATSVSASISGGAASWLRIDYEPGSVSFSDVRLAEGPSGPEVFGRAWSGFMRSIENVEVTAVYRDASGRVIGGDFTEVSSIPSGSAASFQISDGFSDPMRRVTSVDLYFSLDHGSW